MSPRVAVIGGGVIGLAVAYRCAERGAIVTVIDPDPGGGAGASWAAAGMLAPVAEAHHGEADLTRLGMESLGQWAKFAADLEATATIDCGFTTAGTLVVARDNDEWAVLSDLLDLQLAQGLCAQPLTSREARRIEPALSTSIRGVLWLKEDQQVDARQLLRALRSGCSRLGVEFRLSRALSASGARVRLADSTEPLLADWVVVATGANSLPVDCAGDQWVAPLRPVKGQIIRCRVTGSSVFPSRTVRGLDVYVVPRTTGEIVIGATSEDKGFDIAVTVGAIHQLLRDAWELLPGLAEAEFLEARAGFRPGTPDNRPIIGQLDDGGPIFATGHYRHGILLAPITADAVTGTIFGGGTKVAAAFSPTRFASAEISA